MNIYIVGVIVKFKNGDIVALRQSLKISIKNNL
jgi:hypothetical protein